MKVREVAEIIGRGEGLSKFLSSSFGSRFSDFAWERFVEAECFREFCERLANYANAKDGPLSHGRIELFAGVHEMFEKGNEVGGSEIKRHYNLDKSFIGADEANIMLLKETQEGLTQHAIADLLGCSRTSVQKRLSNLADGVRFADSFIRVEHSSSGLKSTVHPIFLPLRLSEVYLLLSVLEDYSRTHRRHVAESIMADDLARRVYAQLSQYAREGIAGGLERRGVTIDEMRPDFDSQVQMDDFERLIMYDKMGARLEVEIKGEKVVGRYVRDAQLEECINFEEGSFEEGCFIMELEDGSLRAIGFGQIISLELVE